MIETWSLPGPATLVASVVADLMDGRQCLLVGAAPPGLRRALEDALALQQEQLRVIYDDPGLAHEAVLQRELLQGPDPTEGFPPGVCWVDGVEDARVVGWIGEMCRMAERMRHNSPGRRMLLTMLVPTDAARSGLDVVSHCAEPLGRLDLEVAARYRAAAAGDRGVLGRLRLEVAVEMATGGLPGVQALEVLEHWMAAPDAVLCNPARFAEHAAASGAEILLPEFELWRAQHTALLAEIERQRFAIVRANAARWRVPYEAPETDGRPRKLVRSVELLELKHLRAQLRASGEPAWSPLLRRIHALRELRNALSHFEYAALAEVGALEARTSG